MPFNSQSSRKCNKKINKLKLAAETGYQAQCEVELPPKPMPPPTLPQSSVLYTLAGRRGDFMAFNRTQRLHYGSIWPNKLVLPSYPPVSRVPSPPPPCYTLNHIFFFCFIFSVPSPIWISNETGLTGREASAGVGVASW